MTRKTVQVQDDDEDKEEAKDDEGRAIEQTAANSFGTIHGRDRLLAGRVICLSMNR